VLDYTRTDPTDGAGRYDLVLDTGGNRPLSRLRRALTASGTLVIVGGEGGGRFLGGFGRAVFRAPIVSRFTKQNLRGLMALTRHDDLVTLRELIDSGQVRPALERTFPLDEAADAIRYLHDGKVRGKVAVTI
jgi:NADPH:quinone reductase-like Zn-dependent oxidoreductase